MENKLKEQRLKAGLAQWQLAEKASVSRTIISQLENGSREIVTSETMRKIAEALNLSVKDIFLL